jgi:DNA end-binding protein Ku
MAVAAWSGMSRALWTGLVNFGLVNIPVQLHTAVRDHMPRFRLLHRKDLSPIREERVCQLDGHPVAWDDLVKGYEIEPGQFIMVTEDDFKTAALERSRSIDILEFVPTADIDPRYWVTPYAVRPGKGADHSYALLVRALADGGRAGIAKYVMRQRQHLAALHVVEGGLMLTTLRFPVDLAETPSVTAGALAAKEVALAKQLVEGLAADWDPARYTDDYVPALMKVIEAKAAGTAAPKARKAAARSTPVSDLVARLRESLALAEQKPRAAAASRRGRRASPTPTRSTGRRTATKPAVRKRRAA